MLWPTPAKDTVVKLPENVRDEDLVLEPLACIYSAVSKAHCSMPGTHVCVVGCGYMGCGAISLLKARGCYVVAVDIRESSRGDALKYGAQEAYSPQEALEKYGTESGHPGFEMVMEWGKPTNPWTLPSSSPVCAASSAWGRITPRGNGWWMYSS